MSPRALFSKNLLALAMVWATGPNLGAADLPSAIQAKFVKILAAAAGSPGKVVCKDPDVMGELEKLGVAQDANSKVAWAKSGEVAALKAAGKFIICSRLDDLPKGGSIAIVEEGGKPQIYLHMGHIAASGVTLSDSVLKIGKRL